MIDRYELLRSAIGAASEVFLTMLHMKIEYIGAAAETGGGELGLISLVGITGDWGGSGVFCCTPALAKTICARMLNTDESPGSATDEEVLDVVAEMSNMIVGNIKNSLEPATGPLAISVPTVIHGQNFHFRNGCGLRGVALSFTAEGEPFEVRISLGPVSKSNQIRSRNPVSGLALA